MPDDEHFPGDAKAAPDPPDYPRGWTTEQRLTAYWEYVRTNAPAIHTPKGWEALLAQAQRRASRREPQRGQPDDDEIGF